MFLSIFEEFKRTSSLKSKSNKYFLMHPYKVFFITGYLKKHRNSNAITKKNKKKTYLNKYQRNHFEKGDKILLITILLKVLGRYSDCIHG